MSKPEVERQKSPNLGFWGRIGLESLWIFCKFFSILPYWFRYYVVEPAVFGALRLLRYRYRVVTENLRNSFPEKSLEELHAIRRGFYRTLAEIFVDTFSLAGLTDEKCRQVVVVKDLEKQMAAVEGRDWIALTAPFRVLGVLFVLGDYRPFAGGRGGLSSPAESRFRRIVQTSAQPCEYLPGTDG